MSAETIKRPKNKDENDVQEPPRYTIVIYDDEDLHPLIVLHVLVSHLSVDRDLAMVLMMSVLSTGQCAYGSYSKDMAETLVHQVEMCEAVKTTNMIIQAEPI